jgi:hypothetical protein
MIRFQYFLDEVFEKRLLSNRFVITVDLCQFGFKWVIMI